MRDAAKAAFILAWVAAWCFLADQAAWAGSIRGSVRLTGTIPAPKKLKVTVDHSVCGTEKDAEDVVLSSERGIRNVVVWLETPPPNTKWTVTPPSQMDQKQCVFVPRVVVAPVGGTVEFLNTDRLLHNLHSASADNPVFNRTQPKGRTIPITFRKPEIIRIDCDLHPWMRAWVVVAPHPFYALTNDQGQFTLENVPAGQYTLHVWHESLGTTRSDVSVTDGITTVPLEMSAK
jgi:plastocyanin